MGLKAPTENAVKAACLDYLRSIGAVAIRVNSGAWKVGDRYIRLNDVPGCSDILACLGGRFVAVETKRPGARTNAVTAAKQAAFAERVERAGGVALTVASVAELQADLRAAGLVKM